MSDYGQQFAPGASIPPRMAEPPESPPPSSGSVAAQAIEVRVVLADAVVVRPGDTLVIQMPDDIPVDEVDAAFNTVKERLPEDCHALVLGGGIYVKVLRGNDSRPALDVPATGIDHCSFCPDPSSPRARYHMGGERAHVE